MCFKRVSKACFNVSTLETSLVSRLLHLKQQNNRGNVLQTILVVTGLVTWRVPSECVCMDRVLQLGRRRGVRRGGDGRRAERRAGR